MTEYYKGVPEGEFIDKTITKCGSRNWENLGIKCNWELHALPEYMDHGDLVLSDKVMDRVIPFFKEKGWTDATVEISEGYDDEKTGKEHYRLKMVIGNGSDNKKLSFSKCYSADIGEGVVEGTVRSVVGLSTDYLKDHQEADKKIAEIYIEEMEKAYPEWTNQWESGKFT